MPATLRRRSLILIGIVALAGLLGAAVIWRQWGPYVRNQEKFQLSAEHIHVSEQPPWILEDVREAAVRDGGLDQLVVTDAALVEKVDSAFGVQTWVAKVNRIRKMPGPAVEVDLEYREPVALVEVLTDEGQRALQPVDADGYVLPEGFLHANTSLIHEFLRISAGFSMPEGPVGTSWGDPRVVGAARICHVLKDHWKELGIYRVAVIESNLSAVGATEYELQTRGGTRIVWGHTVGFEQPGETTSDAKLRLLLHHANNQSLDANGPVTLDLRAARTAMAR